MTDPASSAAQATLELFGVQGEDPSAFDELRAPANGVRASWAALARSLSSLGAHELSARWENGRRILREHGVTYNIHGDPDGLDRPWKLDLVPLLLHAREWTGLELALIQRCQLLNLILADIYGGSQRLLRDGFFPPELIYANPGFLRSCRGLPTRTGIYLHTYACDMARGPDGRWWALADRTQAPSGAGYALENRIVVSRILPEAFRECQVRRLQRFFAAQRDGMLELARSEGDRSSVVLLTPGPRCETYFEHAYLARHLGFPLVEGADLTVRDRQVFLKTLEGLQRVEVILRRVDDDFCDPLELRGDSFLGVPGLVEVARSGGVLLANALGSGLVESPAFLAFLPALARHLLSEELRLPSVATWWCGEAAGLRYVLEHLEKLVVKPAFGGYGRKVWLGEAMTAAERASLGALIRSRPCDFVGQERVILSHAPVWMGTRFESRSVALRGHVANGISGICVLPGGLTRVAKTAEDPVVSMQDGGGSKDTWVIGSGGYEPMAAGSMSVEGRLDDRTLSGVPSRVADNLYWLGRYAERLEQRLRLLRGVLGRCVDETNLEAAHEKEAVVALVVALDVLPVAPTGFADLSDKLLESIYDAACPGGIRELVDRVHSIAAAVRDRLSGDTWRILGQLMTDARGHPGRLPLVTALSQIHHLVFDLAALNGVGMENMTRGFGWRFLDVGRRIERAIAVADLVRVAAQVPGAGQTLLELVLEVADSSMTYRRKYFAEARLAGVVDLLLAEPSNPRSLVFQLEALREHEPALPREQHGAVWEAHSDERWRALVDRVMAECGVERSEVPEATLRKELPGLLTEVTTSLAQFSDRLTHRYFTHTAPRVSVV